MTFGSFISSLVLSTGGGLGHIIKLFFVEIDVKDDFLLKNEVLPSKNVNFV